ncbi:TPA: hypothetical protein QCX97_003504 [Bacillus wiedmannii]|uniref:hypothetical protein n=1 Tax=Bacillus wiedmannii TaxID=1890302 RepID=UPI00087310CC|nr:hypothetical protein [Bacillus wiedmannii]MDR4942953.1 hypothetical protein [Bacillus wiedmannii]OFC98595.1 hypothetical protein BTGOE6_52400 [Bacillus wiedmannii]HDR7669617.1 hypothetical protein [Bacillus wiedmannii]
METTKTSLIQILWHGPYSITDLVKLKNEEIDYGIYQSYGNHPVYGNDVLLYIGCFCPSPQKRVSVTNVEKYRKSLKMIALWVNIVLR